MRKQLILGFTIVLFTFSLVLAGFAAAIEADYLAERETTITGVVQKDGDAFILEAIDGDQYTMSGQDISNMVGKKVQASGQLIRGRDKNSFNVNEIVQIEEDMALEKKPDVQPPIE